MTGRERRAHYVRPNETTRIPRRHIILDTESRAQLVDDVEVQTWRLGVAAFLASEGRREPERWAARFDTPAALWQAVSDHTRPRKRTVLWAHNLTFDLRIAAAFDHLPALGWALVDLNVAGHGAWVRWRRDGATLVMVDSTAIWPASLEAIGADLGLGKPDLPTRDDDAAGWWARCEADVAILEAAVTDYLTWIEDGDLGNWQITGAGQSWAAWRHKFMEHRVLVHDDAEALAAERRAMWTGRCEAWRWGSTGRARVVEFDLANAYARLAAECDVPTRLVSTLGPTTTKRYDQLRRHHAVLADVTVTTSEPVVPALVERWIAWPVGTFTTTLWDVEIDLARSAGACVQIHRAWIYQRRPALAAWARWVLTELDDATATLSPIRRRVVKHWSRALIGRFAMRYRRWEPWGEAPDADLRLISGADVGSGESYQLLRAGRQILAQTGLEEGDGSVPSITGWVMAAARVRLWQVMQAVGMQAVLYVDTDSVLVSGAGVAAARATATAHPGWHLREKRSWPTADIRGPRCLILGASPRIAGVPRAAVRTGPDTLRGEVWQTLAGALKAGRPDQVTVVPRTWRLRGTDHRRLHLGGGLTVPLRLGGPGPVDDGDGDRESADVTGAVRVTLSGDVHAQ